MMRTVVRAVIGTCAAVLLATQALGAQALDIMKPPYAPPDSTVVTAVRAGWLVDVEAGRVLRNRVIIVRGDKIVSVGAAPGHIPAGATVIDLSRYTVTPGLIDCHTHLIGGETSANYLVPLERSSARPRRKRWMASCTRAARYSPGSPLCATSARIARFSTSRCATTSTTDS